MMNANLKHVVEIAVGLVIGSLVSDAASKVVKVTKEAVVKAKEKREN